MGTIVIGEKQYINVHPLCIKGIEERELVKENVDAIYNHTEMIKIYFGIIVTGNSSVNLVMIKTRHHMAALVEINVINYANFIASDKSGSSLS